MNLLPVIAACGLLAASTAGLHRVRRREARELADRVRAQSTVPATVPLAERVARLPPPVARYLRLALGEAPAAPPAIELQQTGRLRTSPAATRWMDFTATHTVAPLACAFAWNARVAIAPALHMRVLDSLVEGVGSGQLLLQSLLTVGHATGTPQMNSGALHRFLAEAVWYPWALLPSEALRWEAIDHDRARAHLTCLGTSVSLEFRFAPAGEVTGISSEGRWGRFDGGYRQLPWEGHFGDYARHGGVVVPTRGEVGWHVQGQLQLVWQGVVAGFTPVAGAR